MSLFPLEKRQCQVYDENQVIKKLIRPTAYFPPLYVRLGQLLKLLEKTPSLSLSMKLSNTLRVIDSITFLVSITKIMKAYLLAEKKLFSHINQTEKVQD